MKYFILPRKDVKSVSDYKLEAILQKGRKQFEKLAKLGLPKSYTILGCIFIKVAHTTTQR
ncbi:MAG: hypothetical protein HY429_04725 [Candidatus Levybacteria bacterium]|nr:hypothetical protein [Candidatus Levybacteria bacterium]